MLNPLRLTVFYLIFLLVLLGGLCGLLPLVQTQHLLLWQSSIGIIYAVCTTLFWFGLLRREYQQISQHQQQLINDAIHDALTQLTNRRAFLGQLESALHRSQRNGSRVGLAFIDLDGFKQVNDIYGHAAGDLLLVAVAERLMQTVRKGDMVARMGGDEFVVLVEPDKNEGCELLAKRLIQAFRQPFDITGNQIDVTLSVGVAFYPDHASEAETLLGAADMAMYRVKKNGRNGYAIVEPGDVLGYEGALQRRGGSDAG